MTENINYPTEKKEFIFGRRETYVQRAEIKLTGREGKQMRSGSTITAKKIYDNTNE